VANFDSPDLLARTKRMAYRPAVDQEMLDADWYKLLGEAQEYWHDLFAVHFPWVLWTAPTLMVTADGGLTYTFPNGVHPKKAQIFDTISGRLLIPAAYWNADGDYVWEGSRIRFPRNQTRTFGDGPYARYIIPPGLLDAGTPPILQPDWARILLPPRACIIWAERGGLRDTSPFEKNENDLWYGDPQRGKVGILGTLKTQSPFGGAEAIRREGIVTGLGYFGALQGRNWP
jgi:hypothetical protein